MSGDEVLLEVSQRFLLEQVAENPETLAYAVLRGLDRLRRRLETGMMERTGPATVVVRVETTARAAK